MSTADVTTSFARTFVDECVRNGVAGAVVSPGSRNTPLTLALVRDGRLPVDVVLDERSAGFRALGMGLASGRPAIVCCTSGTAAANLHPAVVEAHHARVPLLVCTADRPAELRDVGAGQTIDQARLFGDSARWYHDPGPPELGADDEDEVVARWRALVCRAVAQSCGPAAGPVHLNLPFREPLVPTGAPLLDAPGRAGGLPWVRTSVATRNPEPGDVARIAAMVRTTPRGLVVGGSGAGVDAAVVERFARAAGWPVVADPLSRLRTGNVVSTYESLVRAPGFGAAHAPDVVLRIGAPLTSKLTNAWLDRIPTVLVDPDDEWLDPRRATSERLRCDPGSLLAALTVMLGDGDGAGDPAAGRWAAGWRDVEAVARRALDDTLDHDVACEARIARDVAAAVPTGGSLVVASSLPVRALEWSMAPRDPLRVFANRGANGIDGFVSTALGIAAAGAGPVVALCGDLCFLHDTNGLLGGSLPPVTFVVVDNDGGGIFGYLAQRDLPEFEPLFATPQGVDIVAVARAHGVAADRVALDRVPAEVAAGATHARIVVVDVDRATARHHHGEVWKAVAAALGRSGS